MDPLLSKPKQQLVAMVRALEAQLHQRSEGMSEVTLVESKPRDVLREYFFLV